MSAVAMSPEKLSPEARAEALNRYVLSATQAGWRVQSQTQTQVQLVKGKNHSHVLHLILTLLTLGLWLIVWIPLAVFGGEKQKFASVDEYGRVTTS